jgi:hypothetical protein
MDGRGLREVPKDDKWQVEREENDRRRDEISVPGEPVGPSAFDRLIESQMVVISLLMRIYDIQLALLSNVDDENATRIYETHERGGHFNPPVFIPDPNAQEEDE